MYTIIDTVQKPIVNISPIVQLELDESLYTPTISDTISGTLRLLSSF